jgi:hypothetical protein
MEGDGAVEFFEEFGGRFAVDLEELGRDWSFYFCPEGLPVSTALIVFVPAIRVALVLIQIFPRVPGWLSFFARVGRLGKSGRFLGELARARESKVRVT